MWLLRIALLGLTGTATIASVLLVKDANLNTVSQAKNAPIQTTALDPQPLALTPKPENLSPQAANDSTSTKETETTESEEAVEETTPPPSLPPLTEETTQSPQPPSTTTFDLQQGLKYYGPLFGNKLALGMLAIGAAEGNYKIYTQNGTLYVEQTVHYFGHTDPGNLSWGERVTNYGPCSDQGRSGGNLAKAEQICVDRAVSALPVQLQDLAVVGINPIVDLEAVLNIADLYNQASPIHSRRFPQALAIARQGGLTGTDAIVWARTASFYLNDNNQLDLQSGANKANGLIGVCARRGVPTTEWDCVYADQRRRVEAIAHVLQQYVQAAQQSQQPI